MYGTLSGGGIEELQRLTSDALGSDAAEIGRLRVRVPPVAVTINLADPAVYGDLPTFGSAIRGGKERGQ